MIDQRLCLPDVSSFDRYTIPVADDGQQRHPDNRARVQEVAVGGFKSIKDTATVQLRPLTVLSGAQCSGKSSFMQALLLIKQTLEAQSDPGALLLDGPNISFSTASDILTFAKRGQEGPTSFFVEHRETQGQATRLTFKPKDFEVDLEEMSFKRDPDTKSVNFRLNGKVPANFERALSEELRSTLNMDDVTFRIIRNRCFCEVSASQSVSKSTILPRMGPATSLRKLCLELIHIPAIRPLAERSYPLARVGDLYPGKFDTYVPRLLYKLQPSDLAQIGSDLKSMDLTWKVAAKREVNKVVIRVGRMATSRQGGSQDLVNLADAGLTIWQILPIIIALHIARKGQIVYVEHPYIFLSRSARTALTQIAARASSRGVIVIFESTDEIAAEISADLATKQIDNSLIAFHRFSKDSEGNTSVVKTG